ncbi:hypothetical protein D3C80_1497090 [compost metagenome]
MFVIRHIIFGTYLLYDTVDSRVVDMADLREQVMLYLEVQSAGHPGYYFTAGRKVRSCL